MARVRNYVNNKDLLDDLIKFKKAIRKAKRLKLEQPPISRYLAESIMSIANNLAKKSNFANYSFREEMISDGIEKCIMYIHNFDEKRGTPPNPFAYITQIVYNAFVWRIKKEKREALAKSKNFENMIIFNEGLGSQEDAQFFKELYNVEINNSIIENNTTKDKPAKKKAIKKKKVAKRKISIKKFCGD